MFADNMIRLNLNESAYPPLPAVAEVLHQQVLSAHRYPEFTPHGSRRVIAHHLGVSDDMVTVGAGATGVILQALQAALDQYHGVAPELVTATPTFDGFPILAQLLRMDFRGVPLDRGGGVDLDALRTSVTASTVAVIVCSPHNPTGTVVDERELHAFLTSLPDHVTVILDQAYIEFSTAAPDLHRLIARHPRLVVVRTFSKAHGLAALRVGYGVGDERLMSEIRRFEIPFAVSAPAQAAVPVALAATTALAHRVEAMRGARDRLSAQLHAIGASTIAGEGNFVYLPGADGVALGSLLGTCGVAVKTVPGHGVRITVGDTFSNARVLAALRATAATA